MKRTLRIRLTESAAYVITFEEDGIEQGDYTLPSVYGPNELGEICMDWLLAGNLLGIAGAI